MAKRLVSFLGLGRLHAEPPYYTPIVYRWERDGEARSSAATPLVQRALLELEPDIGSVLLLGTDAVKARWIDSGLAAQHMGGRAFGFTRVPDGATSEERWEVFRRVASSLGPSPIAGMEEAAPDAILLDVTHGFRLQPMLGLAAMAFARSNQVREGDAPTPIRVTYGAFEAQADGVAPIWDLTELLVAAEWNAAFDAMFRYGRADALFGLALQTSEEARRSGAPYHKSLASFAKRVRRFADDVSFARTSHVMTRSAGALRRAIAEPEFQHWMRQLPLLARPLALLHTIAGQLEAPELVSHAGLRAQAELVRHYFATGQFASATVAIREGLVDLAAVLLGREAQLDPARATRDAREAIASRLLREDGSRAGTPLERVVYQRDLFYPLRNDILHGGRERPREAPNLREELSRAVDAFGTLARDLLSGPAGRDR